MAVLLGYTPDADLVVDAGGGNHNGTGHYNGETSTAGYVEGLEAGGGAGVIALGVTPAEGTTLGRTTAVQLSVTSTVALARVVVVAQYGGSGLIEELIHDGLAFAAPYATGGNDRTIIVGPPVGYLYTLLRVGGWRGTSLTLKVIAVDTSGTIGYKTVGVAIPTYTWRLAGRD